MLSNPKDLVLLMKEILVIDLFMGGAWAWHRRRRRPSIDNGREYNRHNAEEKKYRKHSVEKKVNDKVENTVKKTVDITVYKNTV